MDKPQIQIRMEKEGDSQAVEKVLAAAAERFGLFDNTVTSRVPNTIRSLGEKNGTGFGLGARVVEPLILVDFYPRSGRTEKFNLVFEHITSELQKLYGERFAFANVQNYIETNPILPLSEAGSKFLWDNFGKSRVG
jgi:hypothetical protein